MRWIGWDEASEGASAMVSTLKVFQRFAPRALKAGIVRRWMRRGTRFDVYATVAAVGRYAEAHLLSEEQLHTEVAAAIGRAGPFLLGRPGSFEAKLVNEYLDFRAHRVAPRDYGEHRWRNIAATGGFPLRTPSEVDEFATDYLSAAVQSDILAVWQSGIIGSGELLRRCRAFVRLADIEPHLAAVKGIRPWTQALLGLRVLIVHPFRQSITSQFQRRSEVPAIEAIFPDCRVEVVVPPQTYAGLGGDASLGWAEHLQRTRESIAAADFDVAIVGAGPYGLPLAAFVKQLGKPAIHLGGATQLLFAIRGGRWDQSELHARFIDETWIRPLPEETPPGASGFEHGSPYW
jgi:hypothetical protein